MKGNTLNASLDFLCRAYSIDLSKPSPIVLNISRAGLCKIYRQLNFRVGAEIGVSKGRFSRTICQYNKKTKLYGVDAWDAYTGYVERKGDRGQNALKKHYEEAKGRTAPYNVELIKGMSMDVVKTFKDDSLDFVFIDGNHTFEYAINDIAEWEKKVRPGGIVSGHDYWNSHEGFGFLKLPVEQFIKGLTDKEKMKVCQVKDAVDAWTKANKISPWFLTGADDLSSWFYVKE